MQQRHHRCGGELELETHGDVQQNPAQRQQQADTALVTQHVAILRTDELDTRYGSLLLCAFGLDRPGDLIPDVRILTGKADDNVRGGAEVLDNGATPPTALQSLTYSSQVSRLTVTELHLSPTGEIETEVELLDRKTGNRRQTEHHSDDVERLTPAHEVYGFVQHLLFLTARSC